MSPSEIAFLAFGLVLGAALGAALVQVAGSRLAPRREVRLTITPNAIPARRSHTLAVPYDTPHPGLIPGSPDAGAFAHAAADVGRAAPGGWRAAGLVAPDGSLGVRTRVSISTVVLPATAVAVPIEVATAGTGRKTWSGMAAPHPSTVVRSSATDRVSPGTAAAPSP